MRFFIGIKKQNAARLLLTLTVSLWFVISLASLIRNYWSLRNEAGEILLSDYDKRTIYLGTVYRVLNEIEKVIPQESRIVILGEDQKTHFLSKYFLYPRRVTYTTDKISIRKYLKNNDYLVVIRESPVNAIKTISLSQANFLKTFKISDFETIIYKL